MYGVEKPSQHKPSGRDIEDDVAAPVSETARLPEQVVGSWSSRLVFKVASTQFQLHVPRRFRASLFRLPTTRGT